MSYENAVLVEDESSSMEQAAAGLVGLSLLSMILGWTTLFQWTSATETLFGVALFDLFGVALTLNGLGIVALGAVSAAGMAETTPSDSAGLVTGALFGLVGLAAGGLVASQTLGLGLVGWVVVALLTGLGVAAVTVLPREDVGSTLPTGALSALVGLLVLGGVFTPGWAWSPNDFSATFGGDVVVPLLVVFVGLVSAWGAAKAHEGFGTRGRQTGAYLLIGMTAIAMLAVLLLLIGQVLKNGWGPLTQKVKFGLFTEPVVWFHMPVLDEYVILEAPGVWFHWPFTMTGQTLGEETVNGVAPAIAGTFWLVLGAVVFSVPLGVGAAVFLTEYSANEAFTSAVEIATNGLWSTPSIVYGLFGYAFLVPRLGNQSTLLAGQLVLGFMMLPLVLITSYEAIKTVPDEYRDASAALGVTKWETIKSVVLPAAMPGIITGTILGVGRIAGETAPIMLVATINNVPAPKVLGSFQFTTGAPFVENTALLRSINALPYEVYSNITQGETAHAWGTALMLLIVVLSFYAVGISMRIYFRRKLQQ